MSAVCRGGNDDAMAMTMKMKGWLVVCSPSVGTEVGDGKTYLKRIFG